MPTKPNGTHQPTWGKPWTLIDGLAGTGLFIGLSIDLFKCVFTLDMFVVNMPSKKSKTTGSTPDNTKINELTRCICSRRHQ